MGNLDDKVAVITGGARGQGRAHAVALAAAGADIVVCDIAEQIASVPYPMSAEDDLAETAKLVEETGRRCVPLRADVRSQTEMNAVAQRAIDDFGHIDILIANAGIASNAPIAEMGDEMWQDMIDTNLNGVFHSIRAVLPHMIERRWGRIVATSSIVARMGVRNAGHYAAAKWGVVGLVKSVSLEVVEYGITVNAVLPGGVDTDMIQNPAMYRLMLPDKENPTREDVMEMFAAGPPNGDLIAPDEVADAVLLLVSEHGRHFNGEALTISGGISANTV
ncbi:mycofactocin-coupled SDR family oxidoreductase [Nocardia ninae]|uniref:3-oxoacyl-[acyl-carrier-protein] reductase MabA n=1 Tax=Nocardia ninae NBRC 108245 TaxID=1210091 RepID=A0A511MD41_9NOCA|nr:mycofactocin-coupled SDR family oxidoreductase [Nocardia ninae]GEM37706.1 putative short-chain dehydrogenase/reductase [Nocardia ninae NBRC 108245]